MFEISNLVVEDVLKIDHLKLTSDIISIEGQSGSGKSTLLRLLNNLDDPSLGTITYNEKALTSISPQQLRKKIVMLPQQPVMFDGTLRDNLVIGQQFAGEAPASDEQLIEILESLWVDKKLDTESSNLSGGEKERVALGRILLMKNAEVYLLDEPSSDLDDQTTSQVMKEFIQQATNDHKQIIMITHDKEVSKTFADTVLNMDTYSEQLRKGVQANERR